MKTNKTPGRLLYETLQSVHSRHELIAVYAGTVKKTKMPSECKRAFEKRLFEIVINEAFI